MLGDVEKHGCSTRWAIMAAFVRGRLATRGSGPLSVAKKLNQRNDEQSGYITSESHPDHLPLGFSQTGSCLFAMGFPKECSTPWHSHSLVQHVVSMTVGVEETAGQRSVIAVK